MKIAVTSQDQINVTQHAGRCNRFWVFETEYADVVAKQWVELPAGTCFHDTTLPPLLSDINVLITGGMASELRYRLKQQAIQSVVTPEPTLNALSMPGSTARWKNYRQLRDLAPSGNPCTKRLPHTMLADPPLAHPLYPETSNGKRYSHETASTPRQNSVHRPLLQQSAGWSR